MIWGSACAKSLGGVCRDRISDSVILVRMAERAAGNSIFSLGRKARGTYVAQLHADQLSTLDLGNHVGAFKPAALDDAYSPYAAAWKRFEKLQRQAKRGGALGWIHWGWGFLTGPVSLFDPHAHTKMIERAIFVSACAFAVFAAVRARFAASQLEHWPCPRCHGEWPGKKSEKEPRCAVCGLKLGQLTP